MRRSRCRATRDNVLGPGRLRLGSATLILMVGAIDGGAPLPVAAQSGEVGATECCLSLLFPIGARALGLGGAISAVPDGGAFFVNPALLAGLRHDEFFVHNARTSIETSNTFTLLIRSDVAGAFALSYRLVDLGEQQVTDDPGNTIGTLSFLEHVLTASYATPVTHGLNAGISYKLFQSRQDCRGFCGESLVGTTHGVDLGAQYRPFESRVLSFGASLMHLGFPLQVINKEQASPTPARLRLGAAYEVLHHFRPDSLAELWLSTDLVSSWRGSGVRNLNVGAELSFERTLFVWAGYGGGSGILGGIGVGVGLNYDRFDVGVAKSFVATLVDESDPFQVTFGIRF